MINRGFENYNSRLGNYATEKLFKDLNDVFLMVIYFGTNDSMNLDKSMEISEKEFKANI